MDEPIDSACTGDRSVDCFQPFQQIFFLSIQSNKAIKVFSSVHLFYLSFGWPHHLRNIIAAINISRARNRVRFDTLGSSGDNGLCTQESLDPSFELKSKLSYARNAGPPGKRSWDIKTIFPNNSKQSMSIASFGCSAGLNEATTWPDPSGTVSHYRAR